MFVLTRETLQNLCTKVFTPEDLETLKLRFADGTELPFWRQLFQKYRRSFLKYDIEETEDKALRIYEYARQDIFKLKLAKAKLEELHKPENFYLTKATGTLDYSNAGSINSEGMKGGRNDKGLLLSRGDIATNSVSKSIGRGGASALNEEFTKIEETWKKRDLALEKEGEKLEASILNINVGERIDLKNISVGTIQNSSLEESPLSPPEDDEEPDVSYTNVTLNKSMDNSKGVTLNSATSLNSSQVDVSVSKNAVTTNVVSKNVKTVGNEFVVNEATYRALTKYVANFRENFLNSFQPLFVKPYFGYKSY